jgi:hypothetical protein
VVDRQIGAMSDAQNRDALQFIVEQPHDPTLAFFIERGRRLVQKDPTRLVQQEASECEALLFATRELLVPACRDIELVARLPRSHRLRACSKSAEEKASSGSG